MSLLQFAKDRKGSSLETGLLGGLGQSGLRALCDLTAWQVKDMIDSLARGCFPTSAFAAAIQAISIDSMDEFETSFDALNSMVVMGGAGISYIQASPDGPEEKRAFLRCVGKALCDDAGDDITAAVDDYIDGIDDDALSQGNLNGPSIMHDIAVLGHSDLAMEGDQDEWEVGGVSAGVVASVATAGYVAYRYRSRITASVRRLWPAIKKATPFAVWMLRLVFRKKGMGAVTGAKSTLKPIRIDLGNP